MTEDQTVIEFDVRTDEMLVNMGPQHPSTHGVLRLVLRTDGEVISEVTPFLGGIEDKSRTSTSPDAPTLVLRGFVMMGGVTLRNP